MLSSPTRQPFLLPIVVICRLISEAGNQGKAPSPPPSRTSVHFSGQETMYGDECQKCLQGRGFDPLARVSPGLIGNPYLDHLKR